MLSILSKFGWTSFSSIMRGGFQIAQLILMTRLLAPSELGVFALVMMVVGLSQVFSDAGLSQAVIYFRNLNFSRLQEIYLFNVLLGLGVSLILFLSSMLVWIYNDEYVLCLYLMLISPIFLIRSIGQQSSALLQKDMRFRLLAKIEVISSLLGFLTFTSLIYLDFRVFSLIMSQIVIASVMTMLLKVNKKTKIPKKFSIRFLDNISVYKYGLFQSLEAMLNYISSQFDQLILVSTLGVNTLGIYSSIKELVFKPAFLFVNPIFNRVSFPLMVNSDEGKLKNVYFWLMNALSMVLLPFYSLVFLYSSEILAFVFGEEWSQHFLLLQLLSIYMFILAIINPSGSLLKATGEVKLGFYWNLVCSILRPIVMLFSIQYGLETMLYSLIFYQFVILIVHCIVLVYPNSNLGIFDYMLSISSSIILLFFSFSITYFISIEFDNIYWIKKLLITSFVFLFLLSIYSVGILKFRESS
ncbi:oligosaccharide flippase family protein [Vibrio sp. Isolate32]|uniref:oligosaccharide flippase family protein n=1 Tax=Vibrio sp. Isolate32 TaxID=2908538 RepID=UPI001EFE16EC|nr:oligosaccharide flippase family protein [Vibrio sp. Isolate32]MCG9553876.1 oligosaccharide flippase family protein [Vibrio sp. Isolate32]